MAERTEFQLPPDTQLSFDDLLPRELSDSFRDKLTRVKQKKEAVELIPDLSTRLNDYIDQFDNDADLPQGLHLRGVVQIEGNMEAFDVKIYRSGNRPSDRATSVYLEGADEFYVVRPRSADVLSTLHHTNWGNRIVHRLQSGEEVSPVRKDSFTPENVGFVNELIDVLKINGSRVLPNESSKTSYVGESAK